MSVSAEEVLGAASEAAVQPVWVVDPDDVIRFVNPAAVAALGYDSADELLGRGSHDTIHHKHPNGMPYSAEECPMRLPRTTGQTVARDLDWFVRRDGSMVPVAHVSVAIEMPEGRGAVVAFAELREHEAVPGARDDALRRIAALVAGGAASADVFAAIAREVGRVIGLPMVVVFRYDTDRTSATVIGTWSEGPHPFQPGTCWPLDGATVLVPVLTTGRPARIDDFTQVPGTIAEGGRQSGLRAVAAAPIIVGSAVWGAMTAVAGRSGLPEHIEDRLAEFTELVATAIANTESRAGLAQLADEQASLRRVATLVAREAPPEEVFATVTDELERILGLDTSAMSRFDPDGMRTVVAISGRLREYFPVGNREKLEGRNISTVVFETGRAARIDSFEDATGPLGVALRKLGMRQAVGAPIVVEGRLWGAMIAASSARQPLPADTEARLGSFTDLVAMAVSNSQARTELAASRARIAVAADETRRQIRRDLHDGAQQRIVHTVVELKLALRALRDGDPGGVELVAEALTHAEQANFELRQLAHGVLPTALVDGGLRAGIEALVSPASVPVSLDVAVDRLPAGVEATAYFVISEALTNVLKHAHADRASVAVRAEDGLLRVEVRDDGIGGADPEHGSGLIGLSDRVGALGGTLQLSSPAGGGTTLLIRLPMA
ncbi:MAG TPA: GAF domain-containing protein [Baekduia sp.]